MSRKIFKIATLVVTISSSVFWSGCSKENESSETKNVGKNQSVATIVNNNTSVSQPASATPSVVNASQTPPGKADVKPPASSVKPPPTPEIGSGGNDMLLLTQVRNALSSDKELLNAVIVEIKEGNATINGTVSSLDQKNRAQQLVKGVNGIKSVKNNLQIGR